LLTTHLSAQFSQTNITQIRCMGVGLGNRCPLQHSIFYHEVVSGNLVSKSQVKTRSSAPTFCHVQLPPPGKTQ